METDGQEARDLTRTCRPRKSLRLLTVSIQRRTIRSTATTTRTSLVPKREFRAHPTFRLLVPVAPEIPTSWHMRSVGMPTSWNASARILCHAAGEGALPVVGCGLH